MPSRTWISVYITREIEIIVESPSHIRSASSILRLIAVLGALLGAALLAGGIYLTFTGGLAAIKFTLFGNDFSSTSIGVAMAFIGAVLVILVFRRVLKSTDRLASAGGAGGNAEVIGDGEARGGKGGSSGPFGPGGNGGNARVRGAGKAVGGAGGNGR